MFRLLESAFLLAIIGCLPLHAVANSLVVVPKAHSKIESGSSVRSKTSFGPRESFHSSREVRGRFPLRNRIDWQFIDQTGFSETLNIEVDAYSVFTPEREVYSCTRSGVCEFVLIPDSYIDSRVTAFIPLTLSQPLFVTVTLEADSLESTPYFQLNYFGQSVIYATDPVSRELSPETTLTPNLTTANPLDVHTFAEQFWVPAGSHSITLELLSSFLERGQLFDGSARIKIEFSTVPEPSSLLLFLVGCPLVFHRGKRR